MGFGFPEELAALVAAREVLHADRDLRWTSSRHPAVAIASSHTCTYALYMVVPKRIAADYLRDHP